MNRVGAFGLLLSASFLLAGCNSGEVCKGDVCYSPIKLTCTVGTECSAPAPSVNGPKPTRFEVWPGLPAGLTLDAATGAVSGTPSRAIGTTHFGIKAITAEGARTGTWELTVKDVAPASLAYSPSSMVCTKGNSCALTALTVTGGVATGFSISPALPEGLSLSHSGVISGAPSTAAAEATYTVSAKNAAGQADATVTISVIEPQVGSLRYSTSIFSCNVGLPCVIAAPGLVGGKASTFSVAPALPDGLTLDAATGGVSGTPTAPQAASAYVFTASNAGGSASQTLTLVVRGQPPAGLSYAATVVCRRNQPCTGAAPTGTGGTSSTFTVTPALPLGLTLDPASGAISGTPTVIQALTHYAVIATNTGGSVTADLALQVDEVPPTSLVYAPTTLSCTEGTVCGLPAPTKAGGPINKYTVTPTLPRGLSISTLDGSLSGKPSGSIAATLFTITGSNSAGSAMAQVTLSVTPIVPGSITYSGSLRCLRNRDCSLAAPTIVGGAPSSYVANPALPVGLTLSPLGEISGRPTVLTASNSYSITGSNVLGSVIATVSIEVDREPANHVTYTPREVTCTRSVPCTVAPPTVQGDAPITFGLASSLPTGLVFDPATGGISGTPTQGIDPTTIYVYGQNSGGYEYGTFIFTVVDFPPTNLVFSPSTKVCAHNNYCTFGPPTNSGGRITSYTTNPALPPGLYFDGSGNLSGYAYSLSEPTVYTVTGTNTGGSTTTTITLSVVDEAPANYQYQPAMACQVGQYCQITPKRDGSPADTMVFTPTLPAWASLDEGGGSIWGTPQATKAPTQYTFTATNAQGTTSGSVWIAIYPAKTPEVFSGDMSLNTFTSVAPHPTDPSVIYARTLTNTIYRTVNSGATWKLMCKDTEEGQGNLVVSTNGTAFSGTGYYVNRVSDKDGGTCDRLARNVQYANFNDRFFAFAPNGRMFGWNIDDQFGYSDDDGTTWTGLGGLKSYYKSLAIDPFDATRVISGHNDQGNGFAKGIVVNGGDEQLYDTGVDFNNPPIFNPKYRGHIYLRMQGLHSVDDGATWPSDSNFALMALDNNGAGYRLENNPPVLMKAPDMRTAPVWAPLYTFSTEQAHYYDDVRISASTIVVRFITSGHVYFSTNSGASFTQLSVVVPLENLQPVSIWAKGNTVLYNLGVTVAKSTNGGGSYTTSPVFEGDLYYLRHYGRLEVSPTNVNHIYMHMRSGTYSSSPYIYHSYDGFQTYSTTTSYSDAWYSWESAFAQDPNNDSVAYVLGSNRVSVTTDGGTDWVKTDITGAPNDWTVWSPTEATVSPWDAGTIFYGMGSYNTNDQPAMYAYDIAAKTSTSLNSRLGIDKPSGMTLFRPTASTWGIRYIGNDGKLAQTLDGTTFSVLSANGPLDPYAYYQRLFKVSATNSSVMATATLRQSRVAFTFDTGTTWFQIDLNDCNNGVSDLAITSNRIIFLCYEGRPQSIPVPP